MTADALDAKNEDQIPYSKENTTAKKNLKVENLNLNAANSFKNSSQNVSLRTKGKKKWSPYSNRKLNKYSDWFNLSIYSAACDNYRHYFLFARRWVVHDWTRDVAASRSEFEERKTNLLKKRESSRKLSEAEKFHMRYLSPPGELPSPIPSSPLTIGYGDRMITIVTTACLPWLTGTSINPLMRAAYIEKYYQQRVTIFFPFIPTDQQRTVYSGLVFHSKNDQKKYVRKWINERLNLKTKFRILFYDAWYDKRKGSIFPLDGSNLPEYIPKEEADVAILEEPEHLCWYHFQAPRWKIKFQTTIGIAHTNYLEYIKRDAVYGGHHIAYFLFFYNYFVVKSNCDLVIRLSAGVQYFWNSIICNVHGVSPQFFRGTDGEEIKFSKSFYFIGKILWGKGYRELCDLLLYFCQKYGFPHFDSNSNSKSIPNGKIQNLQNQPVLEKCNGSRPPDSADSETGYKNDQGSETGYENDQGSETGYISDRGSETGYKNDQGSETGYKNVHAAAFANSIPNGHCNGNSNSNSNSNSNVDSILDSNSNLGSNSNSNSNLDSNLNLNFKIWVDVFGSGFEENEVMGFSKKNNLPITFLGKKDHADPIISQYKIFINPSISDVLCTTTVEALAMGKFVIIADHPSNAFFRENFPENCLAYDYTNPDDFCRVIFQAYNSHPSPLTQKQRKLLTWEDATKRLMEVAGLP